MYTKKDGFARADFDPKTVLSVPNIVTMVRLIILPFVLVALNRQQNIQAFILILLAGFTDVLDGFLAKILHQATTIGKILDPVIDKIFTVAVLIYLYVYRGFPGWAFYIIIILELMILVGGYLLITKHHQIPSSSFYGKLAVIIISLGMYFYIIDVDKINSLSFVGVNIKVITVSLGVILLVIATVTYGCISKKEIRKLNKHIGTKEK
ncbi:MAG: CDP-alcohol phosphatidyltransferase family protein [Candidatus Cloacimonetes bacterium]|nr:CDP-alcohol phosphatidyltransferase family protein [Candidatus Cloacimonadota bacterium]